MGEKYVTRAEKDLLGKTTLVTTREKTYEEEMNDIGRGVGTAVGITALLVGGMINQQRSNKLQQMESLAKQAGSAIERGAYDDALELGGRLLKMGGNEARVIGNSITGIALRHLARYDEAIQHLTTAATEVERAGQAREGANLYLHRGCAYLDKSDLAAALRDFTTFIKLDPGNDSGYVMRGVALKGLGDHQQALEDFARAIKLNPGEAANYRERAALLEAMNEPTKALEDYGRAITLSPRAASLYKLRGGVHQRLGDHRRAIEDFSQAVELRRSDVEALQLRAAAHQALGDSARAAADRERATKLGTSMGAFQSYSAAADSLYRAGFKTWFTAADTRTKVPVAGLVAGGAVLLLPFLCIGAMPRVYGDMAGFYLCVGVFFGAALVVLSVLSALSRSKQARKLTARLAEQERERPGFATFYEAYLKARKEGALDDLAEHTIGLFRA